MTTSVDFRNMVKGHLGLTGTSAEGGYTDADLDNHVQRAVAEFGLYVPLELKTSVAVAASSRSFALTLLTRPMTVAAVEYPTGQWPRALLPFDTWAGTVTIDHSPPAAGYTVDVYYLAQHLVDVSGSTVEAEHEVVISEGAVALAHMARARTWMQNVEANLGIANTPVGKMPPAVVVAEQRLKRWRALLRDLGRGRARTRALYSPSVTGGSKSTVAPI